VGSGTRRCRATVMPGPGIGGSRSSCPTVSAVVFGARLVWQVAAGPCWTQCWLTELSSIPARVPCPRLPTTSDCAPVAARSSTSAEWHCASLVRTSTGRPAWPTASATAIVSSWRLGPAVANPARSWRIHSGRMAAEWCRSSRADRRGRLARLVWWCRPGPRWRRSVDVTDSPTASRCPMVTFEPATGMDRHTSAAPR
jgi:hypothetical protein